jgi:lipocalin
LRKLALQVSTAPLGLGFDTKKIQITQDGALHGKSLAELSAEIPSVSKLDVEQFKGKWYSIAEIPNTQGLESQCTSDRTITYTPLFYKSNSLDITESCVVSTTGPVTMKREISGTITRLDEEYGGRFSADVNGDTAIRYEFVVALL